MKKKEYPPKILLAWAEAMSGNEKISNWLLNNGYPELISCLASLKGNASADKWLFQKGYPEYVALVEYVNRDKKAGEWLLAHGFDVLHAMCDYALEEDDALTKLHMFHRKEIIILAQRFKALADDIDFDANDVHKSPFR